MLRAMKFLMGRGLWLGHGQPAPCRYRIQAVDEYRMLERDSRPMARNTSCIAGASPMISGVVVASLGEPCAWCRCSPGGGSRPAPG